MDKGYHKVFWGLFIATFNINLGIVKILPAFVGWIVISQGIDLLKEQFSTEAFDSAGKFSMLLVLLSLLGGGIALFGGPNINSSLILSYYPILTLGFDMLFGYKLLGGSIEYLEVVGNDELSSQYEGNQRTYTIFMVIAILAYILSNTINSSGLNTASAFLFIIIRISLMVMVNNLKKLYLAPTEV